MPSESGTPPAAVIRLLRLEAVVVLLASLAAYQVLGGNWWVFAFLFLVPDLSMLGMLLGPVTGARAYNLAHTYALPAALAALGWASGADWTIPVAIIWVAHIAFDRGLGYGLKYPGSFRRTHLGFIGKAGTDEPGNANAS